MRRKLRQYGPYRVHLILAACFAIACTPCFAASAIGQEHALPRHLADGEEFTLPPQALVDWGGRMFQANWTIQDGAGRPRTKGNGRSLSDPTSPLTGAPRAVVYASFS